MENVVHCPVLGISVIANLVLVKILNPFGDKISLLLVNFLQIFVLFLLSAWLFPLQHDTSRRLLKMLMLLACMQVSTQC